MPASGYKLTFSPMSNIYNAYKQAVAVTSVKYSYKTWGQGAWFITAKTDHIAPLGLEFL